MGFIDRIKEKLMKPKAKTSEVQKTETMVPGTQTRYGKSLNLATHEKSELVAGLTPREKEIFYLLLEGYTLKEIAKQLGIGYSTVNTHQTAIYRKLYIHSRPELIINYYGISEKNNPGQYHNKEES
jgi:DNA-binding CsgD family transcriptional regulator